jgi:hypothetical protein
MPVTRLWLCLVILLASAPCLPAPILETQEAAKPKPKRTIKPKVTNESSEPSTKRQTPSLPPKSDAGSNRTPFNIPQSQMRASATSQQGGYEASKAIDGDGNSMWHTPFGFLGTRLVSLPQSIMLNLGGTYNVNALHYLPRQDGYLNGAILSYKVYVSMDGSNFTLISAGSWVDDHTEKTAAFSPTKASYIRLEASVGHLGYATAAELNVTAMK